MLTADEVRAELDQILERRTASTRGTSMGAGSDDLDSGRKYLADTVSGGWTVPTWPSSLGGRDADAAEARLISGVLSEYVVPDLYPFAIGLGMAGPSLLTHGTTEQQNRWLPSIASGVEIWCQMFSEPEAGSDLANVAMRAVLDGDEWVLDGQKVWTSRGAYSRWGLCLARTDPEIPKHQGLTMFGVDMEDPGVDVRPLAQMNGDAHFSEVFVSGARVHDEQRIGDVGAGWKVAMTVLAHERAGSSRGGGDGQARDVKVPGWLSDLTKLGVTADPVIRDRAMRAHIEGETTKWTGARASAQPGPAGSGMKLRRGEVYKQRHYLNKDGHGASGMLDDHDGHVDFMTVPSMSIRGGTDEIQHNIVGERVLGLPGEPRVDKDIPYNQSRKGTI